MKILSEYIKEKVAEGVTDFDIKLSLMPNGDIMVDPAGIHGMKFTVTPK